MIASRLLQSNLVLHTMGLCASSEEIERKCLQILNSSGTTAGNNDTSAHRWCSNRANGFEATPAYTVMWPLCFILAARRAAPQQG